jgi:hypothetical protein
MNFVVEPYIRYKFKKLRLDTVKQYKRLNKLAESQKIKKHGSKVEVSDSDSGGDNADSELDNEEF